jgi:hypothetical protein
MLAPIIRLMASRPELLAEHAQAYAELAAIEWQSVSGAALRRAVLGLVAVACLLTGTLLAGVSGLLCAVWPIDQMHQPVLLWAIPAVPLAAAALAGLALARAPRQPAFADMRRQLQADLAVLREAVPP